jgi:dolichyl-diphosphooligosaccharide--protein glycosyltransferase
MKEKLTLLPVSIFSTINEFRPINLSQFVGFTTENVGTAVLAIAGLLLLGIRYPRHILIALPIILTGLSTFKSGNRYIMYLAPFLGMGLGYTIYILIGLLNKRFLQYRRHIVCLGIVLTVFLAFPPQRIHYYPVPYMSRELFSDFKLLKDITEKDAYIWTWWDHGFAIEYLAERGTYVDGGNYHPAKLLFIARSFMTDNELTSKQTISFVTNNLTGEYLFSGQAVSKIVEQSSSYGALPNRQVYIVIDRMMMEYPFLQSLGFSGDFKEGQDLNLFQEAKKCRQLDVSQLSNVETRSLSQSSDDRHDCYFFHVSIPSGEISIPEGKSDIRDIFREILYIDRKEGRAVVLHHNSQSFSQKILQIIKNKRGDLYFMVADLAVRHSIMNRMYALSDSFEHFELVLDDFPHLVAYKVKRDVH